LFWFNINILLYKKTYARIWKSSEGIFRQVENYQADTFTPQTKTFLYLTFYIIISENVCFMFLYSKSSRNMCCVKIRLTFLVNTLQF